MGRRRSSRSTPPALITAGAAAAGLFISAAVCALLAAVVMYVLGGMEFAGFFSRLALCTGGCAGGYLLGKLSRRRGLFGGALCGAVMYVLLSAAELAAFRHMPGIKNLLLLLLSGAAGGVAGVNSKRPRWLRDQ